MNLFFGGLRSSIFCGFGHNTCLYYDRTPLRSQNIFANIAVYCILCFCQSLVTSRAAFCLPCGLSSSFLPPGWWPGTHGQRLLLCKRRRHMFRRRFLWLCKRTCMPLTVKLPSLGGAQLWSFLNKHSNSVYITKRASSAHGSLWKTRCPFLPLLAAQFLLVFSATLRIRVCAFQVASFFGIPANSVHRNVSSPCTCFGQTGER